MRLILSILLSLPLLAQYPPGGSSNASRLKGLPPCSATVTTNCFPSISTAGLIAANSYGAATTVWDDALVPVYQMGQGAASCSIGNYGPSGGIRVWTCGVGKEMDGALQLSHGYKVGTDLKCHVHWNPINTSAGNVKWALEYYWQNINGDLSGGPTTITAEQAASGTAWRHQLAPFPDITGTNMGISSMLIFRLARVAASTSEYGSSAAITSFDCHYQRDSNGSAEATAK